LFFREKYENKTDLELIHLYKEKGGKQVVGVLFKRYTGFVFAVCLKYLKNRTESEDAVMQIFERLFVDLNKHSVSNFKSWLYIVTKNHCLHVIRDRKPHQLNLISSEVLNSKGVEFASNMYHDNEDVLELRVELLEKELCKLSEEQRICLELFYLKDMSYADVVNETGYTLNQVKSYIQNGKRNLRISLKGDE
jgi:RNA polymerase sigma factor (sigma-70 family)